MKSLRFIALLGVTLLLFSCNKFKGNQEIPSYLRIEPFTFTTNYDIEGAATEAIISARLHIDGSLLGVYEFKHHDDGFYAQAPILKDGDHQIHLYPIIKLNGIASTQPDYPFYQPYIINSLTLTQGEITTVSPSTKYYSVDEVDLHFSPMEDFEDINNIVLFPDTTFSNVGIEQISHRTDPNAWMDPLDTLNRFRSGHIHLGDTLLKFRITSEKLTDLPGGGKPALLEIDYKCNEELLVGLIIYSSQDGLLDPKPLVYLRTTDTWKKAYVNLGPNITDYMNVAIYYEFYLQGAVAQGHTADFYFDNIKLVWRE